MSENTEHNSSRLITALNFAACSDRGLVRGNNEDSAYAGPRLLALADGMGGHAAGEVASQFVIDSLRSLDSPLIEASEEDSSSSRRTGFGRNGRSSGSSPSPFAQLTSMLDEAMDEGNQRIAAHVDEHPQLEGMGCTLTALLFRANPAVEAERSTDPDQTTPTSVGVQPTYQVGVCHVGDSRAYLLRGGELTQITKDDTFVQSLVDEGRLAAEDVSSHPLRSRLLKALTGHDVDATLSTFEAEVGDRFMLCSDGLSDPVSADTIRELLGHGTPTQASRKLVEMALRGGGPDNVTVVVADVVEYDPDTNTPIDSSVQLPNTPVLAGALAGESSQFERPDSSAFRAASIQGLSVRSEQVPAESQVNDANSSTSANGSGSHGSTAAQNAGAASSGAAGAAAAGAQAQADRSKGNGSKRRIFRTKAKPTSIPPAQSSTARGAGGRAAGDPGSRGGSAGTGESASGEESSAGRTRRRIITLVIALLIVAALAIAGVLFYNRVMSQYYVAVKDDSTLVINAGAKDALAGIKIDSTEHEVCLDNEGRATLIDAGEKDNCHRFSTDDLTPAAQGMLSDLPAGDFDEIRAQVDRLAAKTLPVCKPTSRTERQTTPGVSCREVV